jgi:hypothetical protein
LGDDALLYTGGGTTELELELLFDVTLAGSSVETDDVRHLTRPLWDLAETRVGDDRPEAEIARFVWGKVWNIPGVVAAVAERLDYFTSAGAPRRSWLRLRMLRVTEPGLAEERIEGMDVKPLSEAAATLAPSQQGPVVHEVLGGRSTDGDDVGERLDELAFRYYGDPSMWRVIASANGVDKLPWLAPGRLLRIPALANLRAEASAK